MNCQEFDRIITDLARRVEVDELALDHIKGCRRCAGRLAEEEGLSAGLLAWAKTSLGEQAPPVVEEKLLQAFRGHAVPAEAPAHRSRKWLWFSGAGSIAASVLVFRLFTAENPTAPAITTPAPPEMAARAPADPVEPAPVAPPKVKIRRERRRAQPVLDSEPAPAEAHFLAVAQGDSWTPLDGGRVMRVKLPRSALRVFGLPMNEERALEQVQADVMLSNDGLLRAIRFVQ